MGCAGLHCFLSRTLDQTSLDPSDKGFSFRSRSHIIRSVDVSSSEVYQFCRGRPPTRNPSKKEVAFSAAANSHSFTLNLPFLLLFSRLLHLPFSRPTFLDLSHLHLTPFELLSTILISDHCYTFTRNLKAHSFFSLLSLLPFGSPLFLSSLPFQLLALVSSTFSHCEFRSPHVLFHLFHLFNLLIAHITNNIQ